ncbi:MAG: DUF3782 domain-containing protein [Sulfolobales archaeon]
MELKEMVRKALREVLEEEPRLLLEILTSKPEVLQEALIRVAPWASILRSIRIIRRSMKDMATKKDLEELQKIMVTKKDLEELQKAMATKKDLEELQKIMATKKDLEAMATKKDLEELRRFVQIRLDALGARWGILNEEAFREGVASILKETGYKVERWIYMDKDGYVYGHPSTIDMDVLIRNDTLILVEITSSVRRGDYIYVKRKAELYEMVMGRKPAKIFIITPYIDDRNPDEIILRAREKGVEIIAPEDVIKEI